MILLAILLFLFIVLAWLPAILTMSPRWAYPTFGLAAACGVASILVVTL